MTALPQEGIYLSVNIKKDKLQPKENLVLNTPIMYHLFYFACKKRLRTFYLTTFYITNGKNKNTEYAKL